LRVDRERLPVWRAPNVLVLGVVSLLNDTASEMVIPLLPAFLTTIGAGALALGWVEGTSDFVSSVIKLVAGRWADRARRYKPFVLVGYALAALVRPLLAFATSAWHVLGVRVTDRTGKGLRTSPRDAILAASVPSDQRGAAFGLHRAMDHAGAVLGPLFAAGVLAFWTKDLRLLFGLAALPGIATVAVLAVGVREKKPPETAPSIEAPLPRTHLVRFLVPLGLFTLGNASDAFLLLKAGVEDAPLETLPLLWMALHVVKSITSVFGGRLADRFGRRPMIVAGWCVYALIYSGFAFAHGQLLVWTLFVTYGIYHGLSEAAERALISELVPRAQWGTGFGIYHLSVGALALVASVLFGFLWNAYDPRVAFLTSAALALAAAIALVAFRPSAGSSTDSGSGPADDRS
jgi:MFS family permease